MLQILLFSWLAEMWGSITWISSTLAEISSFWTGSFNFTWSSLIFIDVNLWLISTIGWARESKSWACRWGVFLFFQKFLREDSCWWLRFRTPQALLLCTKPHSGSQDLMSTSPSLRYYSNSGRAKCLLQQAYPDSDGQKRSGGIPGQNNRSICDLDHHHWWGE